MTRFFNALGPGLLFAGAAVGVSHLVQSTRAGASFGFALIGIVIFANIYKYPAFSFGARYAAATGTSLLQGYRNQGRWALALYGFVTLATMFTVQAAVTLVSGALALNLIGLAGIELPKSAWSLTIACAVLLAICASLLVVGRYRWLQRIINATIVVLVLATLSATVLALTKLDTSSVTLLPPSSIVDQRMTMIAMVALIGWMPSAFDVSIWQSLWTLARGRDTGSPAAVPDVMRDFKIGYWGTAILALSFLTLGASVMHTQGASFSPAAPVFVGQVISLFTEQLGSWSLPLIAASAFTVMFSTTLTVVDGFPRAIATLKDRLSSDEVRETQREVVRKPYWMALLVLGIGSLIVIHSFLGDLKSMVDLATSLSVLTAPVLAWLNHRAVFADRAMGEGRPGKRMMAFSWFGIAASLALVAYYLWALAMPAG